MSPAIGFALMATVATFIGGRFLLRRTFGERASSLTTLFLPIVIAPMIGYVAFTKAVDAGTTIFPNVSRSNVQLVFPEVVEFPSATDFQLCTSWTQSVRLSLRFSVAAAEFEDWRRREPDSWERIREGETIPTPFSMTTKFPDPVVRSGWRKSEGGGDESRHIIYDADDGTLNVFETAF